MAVFTYKAVTEEGIAVSGVEEASSAIEAARRISDRRLFPIDVDERKVPRTIAERLGFGRKVPAGILSRLFENLQTLLDAGIPLTSAITLTSAQMRSGRLSRILGEVALRVENGRTFAEALYPFRHAIPAIFISLIHAAEESGKLPEILGRLVEYVDREAEIKRRITEAMIYPILVILLGIAITTLLLVFMVPHFIEILDNMGVPLPAPTRILIAASAGTRAYGPYLLAGAILAAFLFPRLLRRRGVRRLRDRLLLLTPIVGDLVRKAAIGRFAKTMGTLLDSGLAILPALDLVGPTYGNVVLEEANERLRAGIEAGESLTERLADEGVFPATVVEMVSVGESTGTLDKMLKKIGQLYDKEVERATKRLTLFLEPALIVMLGVVVGFVALALILPMLKAVSAFR